MKLNEIKLTETMFEDIKHIDEFNHEFWYARELSKALNYREYRNFEPIINKAKNVCGNSGQIISDHFVQVHEMIGVGSQAKSEINDYRLSRYSCYLMTQNADSRKK